MSDECCARARLSACARAASVRWAARKRGAGGKVDSVCVCACACAEGEGEGGPSARAQARQATSWTEPARRAAPNPHPNHTLTHTTPRAALLCSPPARTQPRNDLK